MKMKIGFIGLGIMGSRMAANLQKQGHVLVLFNRTRAKAEPLLGPLEGLELDGIQWLIAGGESGVRHRRCDPDWVRDLRDRCLADGIAFFFKQWGGRTSKSGGRTLDGRCHDGWPVPVPRAADLAVA